MGQPGTPRKKGDEFLLAAEGDGWVDRDAVIRHMMQFVMPGQAHRIAARNRKTVDDPRQRDTLRVGSRQVALQTMSMAVKHGAWVREGDMVRHRDWQGESAPVGSPEPGMFIVPDMALVRLHSQMLTGFTKWHWAAVVACYVIEGEEGGDKRSTTAKSSSGLSPSDFAALGIAGLQSKDTVRRYLHIWLDHHNGERPEPGQPVAIPDMADWPTKRVRTRERHAAKGHPSKQPTRAERDPEVIGAWIAANWPAEVVGAVALYLLGQSEAALLAESVADNVIPIRRSS